MLAILPAAFLGVLFMLARRRGQDVRMSLLIASVGCGMVLALLTEALSALTALSRAPLVASWAAVTGVAFVVLLRQPPAARGAAFAGWTRGDHVVMALLLGVFAVEAATALASVSNNWDSLTYHMSRVAHWAQNRSIGFFPTHKQTQNYQPPFAEWCIAHLQVLAGSDRFANLVQSYGMVLSAVATSVIARELGATPRVQGLTAVVSATIPSAIVQTSSTQNDCAAAGWLACAVCFGLQTLRDASTRSALLAGASLGLALLTKGTVYVHVFVFLVVGGCALVNRHRARAVGVIALVAAAALVPNVGHYARNTRLSGNPLAIGISGQWPFTNGRLTPGIVVANVVRNVGLHVATPWSAVNQRTEGAVYRLLGTEVSNPDSSWPGVDFHVIFSCHEDRSGNLLHLVLMVVASTTLLLSRHVPREQRWYVFAVVGGCLFYCLALRWQPWHSRLHVPMFVLASPVVALGASRWLTSSRAQQALAVLLILAAVPWVAANPGRPIFGTRNIFRIVATPWAAIGPQTIFSMPRLDLMTIHSPHWLPAYREACDVIRERGSRTVGVYYGTGDDYWEYPLWVLLNHECGAGGIRIEHVHVDNESRRWETGAFVPDAIVAIGDVPDTIDFTKEGYERVLEHAPIAVYVARGR
jgi:hypothetical protein